MLGPRHIRPHIHTIGAAVPRLPFRPRPRTGSAGVMKSNTSARHRIVVMDRGVGTQGAAGPQVAAGVDGEPSGAHRKGVVKETIVLLLCPILFAVA